MNTSLSDKYCIVGVGETEVQPGVRADHPGHGLRGHTEGHGRRRAGLGRRGWHVELPLRRLYSVHIHHVRPGSSAQLLHGLHRRRVQHRGVGGPGHGRHRSGHGRHHRHLQVHERVLPDTHRGHRGQGRLGGQRTGVDPPPLRADQRGANLRLHFHPPHDGVRGQKRAPGPHQGGPQQPRQQQPQGPHEAAGHGGRRYELPLDSEALRSPPGLLPGDGQRHLRHRDLGGTGQGPAATAGARLGCSGTRHQARGRLSLPARAHHQGCRALHRPPGSSRWPGSPTTTST